jgi:hypothetical protein
MQRAALPFTGEQPGDLFPGLCELLRKVSDLVSALLDRSLHIGAILLGPAVFDFDPEHAAV